MTWAVIRSADQAKRTLGELWEWGSDKPPNGSAPIKRGTPIAQDSAPESNEH